MGPDPSRFCLIRRDRETKKEERPRHRWRSRLFGHGSGIRSPSNDFVPINVYVEAALQPNTLHRR
jgi:hypothetical protein